MSTLQEEKGAGGELLNQKTQVVILLDSKLSREELLQWRPESCKVGGICRIETSTGLCFKAITSGEEKLIHHHLHFDEDVHEAYEWGREELLSAFEAKVDFLFCDLLGPEIVIGEGLDSAVRTILWKETEDEKEEEIEKMLIILVVSDESLIDDVKEQYKLKSNRTYIHYGDFKSFQQLAEKWYEKHHNYYLLKIRRLSFDTTSLEVKSEKVEGHFYTTIRFPLLIGVILLISLELLLYTALLQIINIYEITTRANPNTRKNLELATHEKSWRRCARKLDNLEGKPGGILPESSLAKNFLIRLERALIQIRNADNLERGREEIIRCLFEITAPDAVHTLLPESLYTQNHTGRNQQASKFVSCIEQAIEFLSQENIEIKSELSTKTMTSPRSYSLRRNSSLNFLAGAAFSGNEQDLEFHQLEEKRRLISELSRAYGSTALCLSGGACNAFFHLGVVRTLLEKGVLPKHISGASGGALVGSLICTHTDEELSLLLNNPTQLSKIFDPCSGAGWSTLFKNLMTRPSIFDPHEWAEKCKKKVCGTYTFQEAYTRTGRSLTIMVFNGDRHTRALNHKTAPDVVIYSAVLASSAIPKLLPAIQLLRKTKEGEIVPFLAWGEFWRDGSFEEELPFEALSRVFNASFTFVSQVNPHIVPFFYDNRGSAGRVVEHLGGRGWRGGFLSAFLERVLKQDMKKWLEIMDEFRLLPPLFGTDFSRLFLGQNYGSMTVVPPIRLRDYLNICSDPDTSQKMNHYLITGSRMTFPKLAMIEDRMRVEIALQKAVQKLTSIVVEKGRKDRVRSTSSFLLRDSSISEVDNQQEEEE